jgi:RHS repeat-associated protein
MHRFVSVLSLLVLFPALLFGSAFVSYEERQYAEVDGDQIKEWLFGQDTGETNIQFLEVSNVTSSSAVISWMTDKPCEGRVEYGTTEELGQRAEDSIEGIGQVHWIRIGNLEPGEQVYYRIISGEEQSEISSFEVAKFEVGVPAIVYGVVPEDVGEGIGIVKLRMTGEERSSSLLSCPFNLSGLWHLNLGDLKDTHGNVYSYEEGMTVEIVVEGLGEDGIPSELLSYKAKWEGEGDLSQEQGAALKRIEENGLIGGINLEEPVDGGNETDGTSSKKLTPERAFLERLLAKAPEIEQAHKNRMKNRPSSIKVGWRGGSKMGEASEESKRPERRNKLRLRGDVLARELVELREESSAAAEFFPDVGREFVVKEKNPDDNRSMAFSAVIRGAIEQTPIIWERIPPTISIASPVDGDTIYTHIPWIVVEYDDVGSGVDTSSLQILVNSEDMTHRFDVSDTMAVWYMDRPDTLPGGDNTIEAYIRDYESNEGLATSNFTIFEDTYPPSITITSPVDGSEIYTKEPMVEVIYGDFHSRIDVDSVRIWLNGDEKTDQFEVDSLAAVWFMTSPDTLDEGENTVQAYACDVEGNCQWAYSTFDVLTVSPPEDEHYVNGYVYDGIMFEPVEGAAVTMDSIPGVVYTDSTGHYVFPTPGLGEYGLDITKDGYTDARQYILIEYGHGDAFVDDAYISPQDTVVVRITPGGGVAVNSDASVTATFPESTIVEDIDFSSISEYDQETNAGPLPDRWVSLANVSCWPDSIPFAEPVVTSGDPKKILFLVRILPIVPPVMRIYVVRAIVREFFKPRIYTPIDDSPTNPDDGHVPYSQGSSDYGGSRGGTCVTTPVIPPPPPPNYPNGPPNIIDWLSRPPKSPGGSCPNNGSPSLGNANLKFGGSSVGHDLPSVTSLGISRSLSFTYASHTVQPRAVVGTGIAGIPGEYDIPEYTGAQLNTAGRRFTGISAASRDTTSQRVRFDSKGSDGEYLPSGAYFYTDFLSNFTISEYAEADSFGGEPTSGTGVRTDFPVDFRDNVTGNLMLVDNRISSKIGSGWALNGLQRLHFRTDGDAMVTIGGGASNFYDKIWPGPILDLAVTYYYLDKVGILEGDGEGRFSIAQSCSVGVQPWDIVTGDFNEDGYLDVANTNTFSKDVSVLLGDGAGGFDHYQTFSAGNGAVGIVTEDFDGDSTLDMAVVNQNAETLSIFIGDGLGGFEHLQNYSLNLYPENIVAGDFDGDDDQDLAIANQQSQSVGIYPGDGSGGFGPYSTAAVGRWPEGIITGDFDRDGDLDLAVANSDDDDVSILMGNGVGGFGDRQDYAVGNSPQGMCSGDFNGDEILDLAVANHGHGSVGILLGNDSGGFVYDQDYSSAGNPEEVVTGDLNGDGDLDLVVANFSDKNLSVFLGDGAGGFGEGLFITTESNCHDLILGDFRGEVFESDFRSQEGDFSEMIIDPETVTYTRLYPDSSKVVFDSEGLQVETIDRNGNSTTYEYDSLNRLITVTYPGDLVTTLVYDPDGYLETVTDPAGRITHFDHDVDGNLISITDPDTSLWQYEYDDEHLLTATIDPRENRTTYEYDTKGYVTGIVGPSDGMKSAPTNDFIASDSENTLNEAIDGGQGTPDDPADVVKPDELLNRFVNTMDDTTVSTTDAYGHRTMKKDPLGRVHRAEYNDDGLPTAVIRPDETQLAYVWTETGQIASVTDSSNGATTTTEYDSIYHRPIQVVNALGEITRYELDSRGNTIRSINAAGDTTRYFYDNRGLLTKTINALGDSTLTYYGQTGNLDSLINELGHVMRYEYDTAGNQTAAIDPLNSRTEYEYDDNGRMILARDPLGNETVYIYDPSIVGGSCCGTEDLLLAVINPAGDTTWFDYDEMGRRISTTNPLGNTTYTEYDDEGRVTKQIDPEGRWVSYTYDKAGNVVSQSDSLGRTVSYEYDSRNRKTKVNDPLDAETRYIYNNVGNLINLVNANGDTTSFAYDLLNRKTSETDPLGRTKHIKYNELGLLDTLITANGDMIANEYDELSRLLQKQYPVGSVTYQYDAAGNTLQIDDPDSRLVMTYDANGQLVTVTTGKVGSPQPANAITYDYDAAGRQTIMIDPTSDTTFYYYNENSQLDSLIGPGDNLFGFEKDEIGRVTELSRPNGATTEYQYDRSGQVLSLVHRNSLTLIDSLLYSYNPVGMVSSLIDESDTSSYSYDDLDQVVSASYTDSLQTDEFFTYDSLGNRMTSHLSSGYSYDEGNQIIDDDQYTYTFDANGNMIEKEDQSTLDRWEYTYDYENRLIGVKKYDGGVELSLETSYSYDGLDRRIGKVVNSDTLLYVYDGSAILFEYDETDSILASYVHGPAIDQPLMVIRGENRYYFHANKLGSITALTDSSGAVVQTYQYDAFGNIVDTMTEDDFSPYTYTGREWDDETGLYYYRARYYDAEVGRFLQTDPVGVQIYTYVSNNPTNLIDPSGLVECDDSDDDEICALPTFTMIDFREVELPSILDDYEPPHYEYIPTDFNPYQRPNTTATPELLRTLKPPSGKGLLPGWIPRAALAALKKLEEDPKIIPAAIGAAITGTITGAVTLNPGAAFFVADLTYMGIYGLELPERKWKPVSTTEGRIQAYNSMSQDDWDKFKSGQYNYGTWDKFKSGQYNYGTSEHLRNCKCLQCRY